MFSRLFGGKKKSDQGASRELKGNYSFLQTDIHSHFIPGIDDGAQTVEDSVELITRMKDMGYTSLVTTPHVKMDHYPNTTETIQNGLAILQEELKARNIDMPLRAAAEYYIDDQFLNLLESQPLLTIYDKELLVELSFLTEPMGLNDIIFRIQTLGYRPILAHPERYAFYHQDMNVYREFKDRGCTLQLNLNSLTGYYGRGVKHVAEKLLAEGLYDYCGSDMHHIKHADVLKSMLYSSVYDKLKDYPFRNNQIVV